MKCLDLNNCSRLTDNGPSIQMNGSLDSGRFGPSDRRLCQTLARVTAGENAEVTVFIDVPTTATFDKGNVVEFTESIISESLGSDELWPNVFTDLKPS